MLQTKRNGLPERDVALEREHAERGRLGLVGALFHGSFHGIFPARRVCRRRFLGSPVLLFLFHTLLSLENVDKP